MTACKNYPWTCLHQNLVCIFRHWGSQANLCFTHSCPFHLQQIRLVMQQLGYSILRISVKSEWTNRWWFLLLFRGFKPYEYPFWIPKVYVLVLAMETHHDHLQPGSALKMIRDHRMLMHPIFRQTRWTLVWNPLRFCKWSLHVLCAFELNYVLSFAYTFIFDS